MTDHRPKNVILIGYRGAGKSTVGRLLAQRLGWALVDTDALIEAESGMGIADIFATEGEAGFRRREGDVVARVARGEDQVIAAGGGAVTSSANAEHLQAAGTVVWLTARPEVLWSRIEHDQSTQWTRPDLTATGGLEEVRTVLAKREATYRSVADLTIDTETSEAAASAATIAAAIRQSPK